MTNSICIQSRRIVGTNPGPHLLIFGGVHGDEFEPMAAIRRLATEVDTSRLRGTLTLVPVVNEPAFLRGHRVAEDGLDLARTFPGRPDGSVTEQIAHAAGELIRASDYFIDLHTGGTEVAVLPLAGYMLHSEPSVLDQQRKMAQSFNLPLVWGTSAELDGRSLSVARDAGIPGIYAEYQGAAVCSPDGVEAYVNGCLNVLADLSMLDGRSWLQTTQVIVEDSRPDAGHFQVKYPAPRNGFFEPSVRLGQRVHVGDLLGTITDPLGMSVEQIRAGETGIVVLLRTFPRALAGQFLAAIVEVDANA